MDIVPWRPFGELGRLRREMDDLWSRFFRETALPSAFAWGWAPTVDISETKDSVVLKAEVPGLEAKDPVASMKTMQNPKLQDIAEQVRAKLKALVEKP